MVPLKALLDQLIIWTPCICFLKLFILNEWPAYFLLVRKTGEMIRIKHFSSLKEKIYISYYWSDNGIESINVNWTLPPLQRGSLKIKKVYLEHLSKSIKNCDLINFTDAIFFHFYCSTSKRSFSLIRKVTNYES